MPAPDVLGRTLEGTIMKFSVGVEYAIHCLIYMVDVEDGTCLRTRDLAEFQGISESYLAKTFSKLAQAGIVS